jgi:ATP-binding cassette, subfamily C, bacterial CydD
LSAAVAAGSAGGALLIVQIVLLGHVLDNLVVTRQPPASAWPLLALLVGLALLRAIVSWLGDWSAATAAARAKRQLRDGALAGIVDRGPAGVIGDRGGEIVTTLSAGLDGIDPYVSQFLPLAALAIVIPVAVLATVAVLDPLSALVLAVTGPLTLVFMWLIGSAARQRSAAQWVTMSRLSARFLDALRSMATLAAFGADEREANVLATNGRQFRAVTMAVLRIAFLSSLILELFATIGVAIVAVEIGLRLLYARVTFRAAIVVLMLAPEFYRPLRMLGTAFHAGLTGREALTRVAALQPEPRQAAPADRSVAVGRLADTAPALAWRRVTLSYSPDAPPALRELSLDVPAGSMVALVGPVGSGKSTAVRVVLGLVTPQSGAFFVNGAPVTGPSAWDAWRRSVGWVPQHPHLFQGNVFDNVRLAKSDATEAEVRRALEQAGAASFVAALPHGLHTTLGERGERLSTGQAQRIAIARAFLKDAPLLVLDEPTAFLDPDTETQILAAIDRLRAGRTVLMVAHRLRTVRQADTIVVLDHGSVAAQGSHDDVLRSSPLYARLYAASGARP